MKKITNWIKNNRLESAIILLIILLAAYLRFYRLPEYMTFLGDEGRDAIVIKKILVAHDIPFIGPPTSIGNMYLGPLYYYMMAVPMGIFWLNPAAAAYQVALIGLLTVGLIYYLTRIWFGKWAGAVASFSYAISPVNIMLSRSSWNPNPAPFFALLAIFSMHKLHKTGNFLWLILSGIALAFAVQMHYLALILLPILGVVYLYEIYKRKTSKQIIKNLTLGTFLGIISFLILMSPLVVFDFKHNFINYRAITAFFTNRETTVNLNLLNTTARIAPIYNDDLIGRYITQGNPLLTLLVSVLVLIPTVLAIYLYFKKKQINWPTLTLSAWLFIGVLGLALYKQSIFDHYLGFLNPAPYILLGSVIFLIKDKFAILKYPFWILVLIIAFFNFQNNPFKHEPNNQLKHTQDISKFVIKEADNKPFNFALLAKSNYDSAYQFYLDEYGHKPLQVPFDITDQLIVVCEDLDCQPVGNSKYEIAGFGMTKVESITDYMGVKIYKLIHNPTGEKQ